MKLLRHKSGDNHGKREEDERSDGQLHSTPTEVATNEICNNNQYACKQKHEPLNRKWKRKQRLMARVDLHLKL